MTFFTLPHELVAKIFSEFLTVGDIGRLDSAFLNHSFRHEFLSVCSHVELNYKLFITSDAFAKWMSLRRIRAIAIKFTNSAIVSGCKMNFSMLKSLDLRFSQRVTNEIVLTILQAAPKLETLFLERNIELDDEVMDVIAQYAPKLKNLSCTDLKISELGVRRLVDAQSLEKVVLQNCESAFGELAFDSVNCSLTDKFGKKFSLSRYIPRNMGE
jgi:hypothetical protein